MGRLLITERVEPLIVALVLLAAVFWPLERLFAARRGQAWLGPRLATDVAFMAGQDLVWTAAALRVQVKRLGLLGLVVPEALRETVRSWPYALQALSVVMPGEVSVY